MLTKKDIGPYPDFFERYVSQLPDSDIFTLLQEQPVQLKNMIKSFSEEAAEKGYTPGKWSVKEVMGHLIDTERVFMYRIMCISRGETQSLPGFDENIYVQHGQFNARSLINLILEYESQRQATIAFFQTLTPAMLSRVGTANQKTISVKALVIITAAHELHHLHILKERYLPLTL